MNAMGFTKHADIPKKDTKVLTAEEAERLKQSNSLLPTGK